jgi:hypothetical protein
MEAGKGRRIRAPKIRRPPSRFPSWRGPLALPWAWARSWHPGRCFLPFRPPARPGPSLLWVLPGEAFPDRARWNLPDHEKVSLFGGLRRVLPDDAFPCRSRGEPSGAWFCFFPAGAGPPWGSIVRPSRGEPPGVKLTWLAWRAIPGAPPACPVRFPGLGRSRGSGSRGEGDGARSGLPWAFRNCPERAQERASRARA